MSSSNTFEKNGKLPYLRFTGLVHLKFLMKMCLLNQLTFTRPLQAQLASKNQDRIFFDNQIHQNSVVMTLHWVNLVGGFNRSTATTVVTNVPLCHRTSCENTVCRSIPFPVFIHAGSNSKATCSGASSVLSWGSICWWGQVNAKPGLSSPLTIL